MLAIAALLSQAHIDAATVAAQAYDVDRSVLLAIAEHETTWDATLRNGYACGPMQVVPVDDSGHWDRGLCNAMAVPLIGYLEGARALRGRLRFARGELRPALRLYGCGWARDEENEIIRPAAIPAQCNGFDGYVVAHAALIAKKLRTRTTT